MIVSKFGGTSVANATCNILKIVQNILIKNKLIVVVSALSGITNKLTELFETSDIKILDSIHKIHCDWMQKYKCDGIDILENHLSYIKNILQKQYELPEIKYSAVVSVGEILSSELISRYLTQNNVENTPVNATNCIITDENYKNASYLPLETDKAVSALLKPIISAGIVPVVTGFIGSALNGNTTTLGRGGSDYSATIIGSILGVNEIQIWTDVNGVFSADPNIYHDATLFSHISYQTAESLSLSGAKILYSRCILPAKEAKIPLKVVNTFNQLVPGTVVADRN